MSFWSDVTDFAEGAWESVSTGAQEALGDWASGNQGEASQTQQASQAETTTTTGTTTTSQTGSGGFQIGQTEILLGVVGLLAVVLVLRK